MSTAKRVKVLSVEREVDPRARQLDTAGSGVFVFRFLERTGARGTFENVLTEERELRVGALEVERDHVGERARARTGRVSSRREVSVDPTVELVEQDRQLIL